MEYKRIFEQGKKLEQFLKDNRTEEEEAQMYEELEIYHGMLEQWEKAKDAFHHRRLLVDITEMNKPSNKKLTEWKWVTISPADGKEKEFIAKTMKFMSRPCMKGSYCFEQRGEEEGDYHGLHCHALLRYYPNLTRDLTCQFKKFCDKAHINIKNNTEEDVERRKVYMGGVKVGEQKQPKIKNDANMRKIYDLKDIYTC